MDDVTRQAFATAVGVLAGVYVALWAGFDQPYWAGISALIISNVDRTALFTKGVLRIAGTIAGVVGGYYACQWLEGLAVQQALFVMLAAGIGTYARQRSAHGYAWFYGALSFLLILLCSMTTPEQLYSFALFRCYEIVIGVAAATLANWALGPRAGELPAGIVSVATGASHEEALRQSFAAAVGAICIVFAWVIFDLPWLTQVLITALVVVDTDPAATRRRGWQRIVGCVIGGSVGLIIIGIDAVHFWWWAGTLFLGIFLFARRHLGKSPDAYIGTQSALALIVTMVGTGPPDSILPPLNRLMGIVLGVALMSLVVWAFNSRAMAARRAGAEPG